MEISQSASCFADPGNVLHSLRGRCDETHRVRSIAGKWPGEVWTKSLPVGVSSEEVDILGCVVVVLRCSGIHAVMHLMEQSMYIYELIVCKLPFIAITFFGILIFLWALCTVNIFPGWSQGGWWYRATFMLLRTSTGDGKLNTQYSKSTCSSNNRSPQMFVLNIWYWFVYFPWN